MHGRLWVTEQSLSFLPESKEQKGFQVSFPSIALHAVSRSVPEDILKNASHGQTYERGSCIYCQLDDHPERDEDEEEEEDAIVELWLVVRDADTRMCFGLTQWRNCLMHFRTAPVCTLRVWTRTRMEEILSRALHLLDLG